MKDVTTLLIAVMLMLGMCACGTKTPVTEPIEQQVQQKASQVLSAVLVQTGRNALLVCDAGMDAAPESLYWVTVNSQIIDINGELIDYTQLKSGQRLEIAFSGDVAESYPAQIDDAQSITVVSEGTNLIAMYKAAIDRLIDTDPALNIDCEVFAFDLSGMGNLSDGEKSALLYLIENERTTQAGDGSTHTIETMAGTYEQLCQQGYIDGDKLYFEKGILITVSATDLRADSFTFCLSKWRGGDGAVGSDDCSATLSDGVWSYEPGSSWIS